MSEYKSGCEGWHKNMVSKCMCGNLCKSCAIKYSLEKERDELKAVVKNVYTQALYDSEKILNIIEGSSIGLVMRSVRGNILNEPYFESDHKVIKGGEG